MGGCESPDMNISVTAVPRGRPLLLSGFGRSVTAVPHETLRTEQWHTIDGRDARTTLTGNGCGISCSGRPPVAAVIAFWLRQICDGRPPRNTAHRAVTHNRRARRPYHPGISHLPGSDCCGHLHNERSAGTPWQSRILAIEGSPMPKLNLQLDFRAGAGQEARVKRPFRLMTFPSASITPPRRRSQTMSQCRPLSFLEPVSG